MSDKSVCQRPIARVFQVQPGYQFEQLSSDIIGAALAVHRALGPGFTESVYHNAMCIALEKRKLAFETQRMVEIEFEGVSIGRHLLDLVVGQEIVIELKSVAALTDTHFAQIRSYLKASRLARGITPQFQRGNASNSTIC